MDLGDGERGLTLTTEGRDLLDSHSLERDGEPSQVFYAGVSRSREIDHDSNLYATFRQEEARLRDEHPDLEIRRVILEQDLKREYQEFLQEPQPRSLRQRRPTWPRRERGPRLGARARSAVLRRPGAFPRLPNRVRGRWPGASPGRRAVHAALPRRSRRQPRQDRLPHLRRRLSRWRRSFRAASARDGGVPVTHEYPPNRTFDSVSVSRVSALARLRLDAAAARVPRDRHGPLRDVFWSGSTASSPAPRAARTAGSSWPGWWPADSPEPSSQGPSDVGACTTSTTSRSTRRLAKRTTATVVFARSAAWSSG